MRTAQECRDCGFLITDDKCCKNRLKGQHTDKPPLYVSDITEQDVINWLIHHEYPIHKTNLEMAGATIGLIKKLNSKLKQIKDILK